MAPYKLPQAEAAENERKEVSAVNLAVKLESGERAQKIWILDGSRAIHDACRSGREDYWMDGWSADGTSPWF